MKKIAFLLMLSLLFSSYAVVLCSCIDETQDTPQDSTTTTAATTTGVTSQEDTTTQNYVSDDLPDDDFEDATITIMTTTWRDAKQYIYAEQQNSELVNDALFSARSDVSDRFNVEIMLLINGVAADLNKAVGVMANSNTDSGCDIIYNHDKMTVNNALDGDFIDITTIESINTEKPWWTQSSNDLRIADKLFFTSSYLSVSAPYMNLILAVNKELAEEYDREIPYAKAMAGEWYLSDLMEMVENMNQELDGDGVTTEADLFGFVTSYYGNMCMQANAGVTFLDRDDDGGLIYKDDKESVTNFMSALEKLFANGTDDYGSTTLYGSEIFAAGNALFMYGETRVVVEQTRDSGVIWGVLPFPKFNSQQENYRSAGFDILWGIIKTAEERKEMVGTIVEALSCKNYNNVLPAIWEILLGLRMSESQDDSNMFKIIRDAQYVYADYIFSDRISGLGSLICLWSATTPNNVISHISKSEKLIGLGLNQLTKKVDALTKND